MRTSVSLPEELASYVDEEFSQEDESDAQAIRDAVLRAKELESENGELREKIDEVREEVRELENTRDRLQNRVTALIEDREERQELVAYAETTRDRLEAREKAGILTRGKWFLFGRNPDE
jgi:uncharacterized coiled-coil DUF342 family protein